MIRWSRSTAALSLLFAAACGGGDGGNDPPPAPAAVVAVSANPLANAAVATAVAAPTFEVRTAAGVAIRDVPVTVAVTAGGGTLVGAPTLSLAGPTGIGTWTLGTAAGAQSVTVTVAGLTPLVFTVQSQAGAPAELQIVQGDNQFGVGGSPATIAPRVRVRDAFTNPVAGAVVGWTVDAGGGNLAAATSVSDAQGLATAPTWTLGAGPAGEQAVVATLNALSARFEAFTGVVPASLTIEIAAPVNATVGTALATAPAFAVRDSSGTAISGFPVTVSVTGGGGALAGAPTATTAGSTAIGTWTMGTVVGAQVVTVTAIGLPPATFTVQATPGAVATLTAISGNNQTALAGDFVPASPVVRLEDQFGNRVPSQLVTWTVDQGGGTVAALPQAQTASNASGEAAAPAWRLGLSAIPQQISAAANGRTALITANIQTGYRVTLRYIGPEATGAVATAFNNAVRRIEAVVVGDLVDIPITNTIPTCLTGSLLTPINETVEDVLIFARVDSIDGPGGILGSAGPCLIRNNDQLTVVGSMRFDNADLAGLAAQGRLEAVILHEMLHVIGIGTLWDLKGLLADRDLPTVRFTGALAREACATLNSGPNACAVAVPAENCLDLAPGTNCGGGTRNSHWKESTFQGELMTGYLSPGVNPFSAFTIRSLSDIGYEANILAADDFAVPAPGLMAYLRDMSTSDLRLPTPIKPSHTVDRLGRLTPIPDR